MIKKIGLIVALTLIPFSHSRAGWVDESEPYVGIRFSNPQGFSLPIGIMFPPERMQNQPDSSEGFAPSVFVEPGVGGIKAGLGWGYVLLAPGGAFGAKLKGAYLQTWVNSQMIAPNQDYIGVELEGTFFIFQGHVGTYKRIRGSHDGDKSFLSLGIGLGFL